jgi:energy-coupling factor transport system ATP-binding protein
MNFQLRSVSFSYRSRIGYSTSVFEGLNFTVEQGECVGVIGHEGAGKSTLLQLMNGLLRPDQGTVLVDGRDIWSQVKLIHELRRRIGFAFQFPEQQFFCETVRDELEFAVKNFWGKDAQGFLSAEAAVESVGLRPEGLLNRSPFSLSMGEARRVALASLLVSRPQALLLDEPTVGLDGAGAEMVNRFLRRLHREGVTVVLVSHDIDVLAEVATRIVVVEKGRFVEDGSVAQLLTDESVLAQYGYQLPEVVQFMDEMRLAGHAIDNRFYTFGEARDMMRDLRSGS